MDTDPARFAQFAVNVFGVDADFADPKLTGLRGIAAYERWCHSIGMPTTISEMGVEPTDEELRRIAQSICDERGGTCGFFQVLTVDDVEQILRSAR
jgi:alcohol dehydrogenase YqhD (iron-dependent ADH family)